LAAAVAVAPLALLMVNLVALVAALEEVEHQALEVLELQAKEMQVVTILELQDLTIPLLAVAEPEHLAELAIIQHLEMVVMETHPLLADLQ
jgi:hypothetical protein